MPIEKITTRQIISFITLTRVSVALSQMPTINLPPYNQDMWIMIIVSYFYTLILMIPLLFLSNKFSDISVIGYMKKIYGKTIGKIIGILYGLYFITSSINGTTIQTELIASTILVDASNLLIILFMIVTMIYCLSTGVINLLRGSELLAPITFIIGLLLIILGLNNVDFSILLPILKDSTFAEINNGALRLSLLFTDIFLLVMIVPELENKKDVNKIFIISAGASLLFLIIAVIVCYGSLGIEQTRHSNFPFLLYTRLIKAFNIFERIDAIFIMSWIVAILARNAGFFYIAIRTFRELLNKKEDEKIILYIIGAIIGFVSYYILQMRPVIGIRKEFDLFYSILFIIFGITIPIITCIVYFFRRKSLDMEEPLQENK